MKRPPSTPRQDPPKADDRKVRLAAALKQNIAKRKAQAAAKTTPAKGEPEGH